MIDENAESRINRSWILNGRCFPPKYRRRGVGRLYGSFQVKKIVFFYIYI